MTDEQQTDPTAQPSSIISPEEVAVTDDTSSPSVGAPPLITVVVPCFNHGKYLAEAVESLLVQTYENLEIIVVNDGSTDNSSEVAKQLCAMDSRIRLIDLPENKGKWNALNLAISECKGLIVTCQDADDISLPDRIKRQFDTMSATGSVHNLCGFHHCFTAEHVAEHRDERVEGDLKGLDSDTVAKMVEYGFTTEGINHYFTAEFETAGTSAMFIKALWNVGFRFNPPNMGLRVALSEDSDFNVRVTLALRNTTVLAEKLYLYRRGTGTNQEQM
jgi:glycosyltransferase involved in cell wall biosynthesis